MKSILLLLGCFLFCCGLTLARNPGLKVKLSQNGLNYAAGLVVNRFSHKVKGQAIPDQHGRSKIAGGKVDYDITGMRITSFTRPQISIVTDAGVGITLKLNNAGFSVHGNWAYKYRLFIKIRDHGSFDVTVNSVYLRLAVALGVDSTGRPTISTRSCDCDVSDIRVKFHGGASWLYNLFSKSVEKTFARRMRSQLCETLQTVINVDAAKSLKKMKVRIPIEGLLTLDYSLVAAPVFGTGYLESLHKGEFFWTTNQTEAPFKPSPVGELPGAQKMVTFFLSDYVSNSLGYVIFTYGSEYLRYSLTQKDLPPEYRHYLSSTVYPPIATKYPNSTLEVFTRATQQPSVETSNKKILGHLLGSADFKIRESNRQLLDWFTIDVKAVAVTEVNMTGQVIKAHVKYLGVRISITKTVTQPVPPESLINLVFNVVARLFVVEKLNEVGQKGIALPVLDHVEYVNPELHLLNTAVCFTTDLKYVSKLQGNHHQNTAG